MQDQTTAALERFRGRLYHGVLGARRDALFELLDAVLAADGPTSLVRHSLAPAFRRGWASACDAIADGTLDAAALGRVCAGLAPAPVAEERALWAVDGTTWPRPAAKTSPGRTWARFVTGGQPQDGVVPGWEWLVAVPEPRGSWVLPLAVARRDPAAGTPTALAVRQLRTTLRARPAPAPRPVVTLDSHYDLADLVSAGLACDLLVRLPKRRRLYRAPPAYRGMGRPAMHGPCFLLHDPASHGPPDRTEAVEDPARGRVVVDLWRGLHAREAPVHPVAVIRVQPERLPRRARPPEPLWLAWWGEPEPVALADAWHWYERRFAIEHGFRFLKQDLGWTTVRLRDPAAAARWTQLLAAGLWQLWLARGLVADTRLPWERPLPPDRLTPGRARRGFGDFLASLGTPARPPKPRGKSPGRRLGDRPGPRERCAVHRRGPPTAPPPDLVARAPIPPSPPRLATVPVCPNTRS